MNSPKFILLKLKLFSLQERIYGAKKDQGWGEVVGIEGRENHHPWPTEMH